MAEPNPTLPPLDPQDVARFHELVEQRGPDECWPWKASTLAGGYGQWKRGRRTLKAHRVAYFLHYHADPGPALVMHSCDNPPCCNPRHLLLGTWKDNLADCAAKGRTNRFFGDAHWSHRKPGLVSRGEKVGGSKLTEEVVVELRRLYAAGGFTQQKLADKFGLSREGVGCALRGQNWRHLPGAIDSLSPVALANKARAGERHPTAKLTEQQVREIRRLFASNNHTQKELAAMFGVSAVNVYQIVSRRSWRHIA